LVASVPVRHPIRSAQIAIDRAAPSVPHRPAGSFLGGLPTPAHERVAMFVTGRHPQPFTKPESTIDPGRVGASVHHHSTTKTMASVSLMTPPLRRPAA
jgi:hypothetical protein